MGAAGRPRGLRRAAPGGDSYLNVRNLIGAAETTGCDAVHPGWGFLAENAAFVRACQDNDLVFVGPGPEAIELMGDKSMAKRTMRDAGVPLVPGSADRLAGPEAAVSWPRTRSDTRCC